MITAPLPALTRRDVHPPRVPRKAVAVIGVRRSGKTSFLYQCLADRLAAGRPRDSLLLLALEDDRLDGITTDDLSWLVEEYYRQFPARRETAAVTLCLDEIQVVPAWERLVRRLMDTENIELLISGSSAKLLSREIATALRGRAMEVLVHPFSFREVLRHARMEPSGAWTRLGRSDRSALDARLRDYLLCGGFPEAQGLNARDRQKLLQGYVDTMVLRDVIERHAVSNVVALRWLQRELLASPAGMFSISKFFNALKSQGVSVGKDTLHAYLSHLEDAFMIRTVALHTPSERKRMVNSRKAYPVDPGLIPLFQRTTEPQTGHALETAVMLELERREYQVGYVRTSDDLEVDFHASAHGRETLLLQVCADTSNASTLDRELRALASARSVYPRARAILVTLDADPPMGTLPAHIEWQPAARWLLEAEAPA
ncbi:MAG TPA: ATP-binding protein [Gemmatimonadaceae bacterium]|nr:ATP-binding protein [Gemmatimonadaceae bacterium]